MRRERLPSTRELARRYGIHANTASAAYQQLEQEGWIELRHGSGVFVKASPPLAPQSPRQATEYALDQLIGELMAGASKLGAPESMVRGSGCANGLALTPPSRGPVIDPEPELRSILIDEMRQALRLPIEECTPEEAGRPGRIDGAMPVTVPSKAALLRAVARRSRADRAHGASGLAELMVHLQRYQPKHAGELVGIASRCRSLCGSPRRCLVAAGLAPESLLVRGMSLEELLAEIRSELGNPAESFWERNRAPLYSLCIRWNILFSARLQAHAK